MTGRRFESFEPHELRVLASGLRDYRNHVFPNHFRGGEPKSEGLKLANRLIQEAESVLAEHDEEARIETDELMQARGR